MGSRAEGRKTQLLSAAFTGFVAGHGVASRRPGPLRAAQAEREFVVPPVVHVYGGPAGDVDAERSAGFLEWVDGSASITVRNMICRLFMNQDEIAARFIRLRSIYSPAPRAGVLPSASGTSTAAVLGEDSEQEGRGARGAGLDPSEVPAATMQATPSPARDEDRTPAQRTRDAATYGLIVRLVNHAPGYGLTLSSQRAVDMQARHLLEPGKHDAVAAVASAIKNAWLRHTVSATNSGMKQNLKTYRPYVLRI